MSDATQIQFKGSIPQNYDRYLAPLFFNAYADEMVRRVRMRPGMRVLEIAAGTGIVTQRLIAALPHDAHLTATDFSESMLAIAKSKPGMERAEFQQADATALHFTDASFDVVLCQFGLMFFPDKDRAIAEAYRVLSPGGEVLFSVWDCLDANLVAKVAHDLANETFADAPPDFFNVPFGLTDRALLHSLFKDAGFADVAIEPVALTTESPSAQGAAIGLFQGTPILVAIMDMAPDKLQPLTDQLERELKAKFGDHPMKTDLQAIFCSARKL